jgi:pimeloyl-ACP methyl ester carboxylesterase
LAIAPLLRDRCRLLAPDLAGHGLTESLGRSTSVPANRLLLHRFLETVPGSPVILLGNSMGGMLALLEAGLKPESTAGLVLLDAASPFLPAVPHPAVAAVFAAYATPLLGRAIMAARRRTMTPEAAVGMILRLCCADPSRVAPDVVEEHVVLARRRNEFADADRDFLRAARSVAATANGLPKSAYRAAIRAIRAPALLIHGDQDRLIPVSASRALAQQHSDWQLVVMPGIGHVPQLEAPDLTAKAILRWFDSSSEAVNAATHKSPADA